MKSKLRASYTIRWLLLINFLGLAISVLVYYVYRIDSLELIVAVQATAILFSLGFTNYRIENDRIFLKLFEKFNMRYGVMNNNLNVEGEIVKKTMEDYLNLCSEEYLWYKKGRIPEDVWNAWEAGIRYDLVKSSFQEYLRNEEKLNDSYYGFIKRIKRYNLISNSHHPTPPTPSPHPPA